MDAARWILGMKPKRTQPAKVETDIVYPVHDLDDTPLNRKMNLTWTLRFEDVLDVQVLQGSLTRVLERDDWRKVGGRLRFTSAGGLELHVPKEFTPERPAFRLSQQKFDMALMDHPVARQMPRPADHPYSHPQNNKFRMFEAREDIPLTPEDLCYTDEPQLSVHVSSFRDETLVALTWPHTMTSALGRQALMRAWSLMLAGRESEIPPLSGARDDPMDKIGRAPPAEPFVLEDKRLRGLSFARFAFNTLWDMYWHPHMDVRLMYLPGSFVARLRSRAQDDLARAAGPAAKPPFVSEGDVLAAWAARVLARSRGGRPVTALTAVDVQGRFASVFRAGHAYVQNTILGTYTLFCAGAASFGQQAHEVRKSIVQQTTETQCEALLRVGREIDDTPLYGDANSVLMVVTNWTKARFFEVIDFAPAVVAEGVPREQRRTEPGRVVYHYPNVLVQSTVVRECLNVLGKDQDGNYWVKGEFLPDCWELFEQELAAEKCEKC